MTKHITKTKVIYPVRSRDREAISDTMKTSTGKWSSTKQSDLKIAICF